jgi:hypothetical protein
MKAQKRSRTASSNCPQCSELRRDCKRLRQELLLVKAERDQYLKALYALSYEDCDFDKDALLALVGKRRPLAELIAGLESRGN